MGTCFQVPWSRMAEPSADLARLRDAGFELAATTLSPGSIELDAYQAPAKLLSWTSLVPQCL